MAMIVCAKCGVKNYLDPYPFWNFDGTFKCAGCDTVYALTLENYQLTAGPTETEGDWDRLPGYAETADWEPITDEGKVAPPPMARPQMALKPIPITRNVRGNLVSGKPLTADDLDELGRPKFIVEQRDPD
jgi:hypothetical protein